MFPYRKILELHGDDVSLRGIAMMTRHSRQKVTEVIQIAERKGVKLPLDDDITDPWLEDFLYPEKKQEVNGRHSMDFERIHMELSKPNVTLTLLHDEYVREAHSAKKIPYAYRTFAEHYHKYAMKYKATMRIWRKPGEILEVDWAGTTLSVIDPDTGEKRKVYVFIATLPCSQLFYVEGAFNTELSSWVRLHQHTFEYIGGTPQIIVPDNLKTGVTKHTSKELILNKTYAEMAAHYETVIMPARVRSPKDKASVEGSVNIVTTWIIQALRNVTCFSLEELNREIWRKLETLNNRPFQNRPGSRWSAFLEEEKFALSPLPDAPYKLSTWRKAKVRPDYHITVNSMFYSVPHELIGKEVEIKVSPHMIEVYFNHMRVASHQILYGKFGQFSTLKEHMPDNHRLYVEQTPEEAMKWAAEVGPSASQIVTFILNQYDVEKQALNAVFTLKKLERTYLSYEIEHACKLVLEATNRPTVKSVQTMIKTVHKEDERKTSEINSETTDKKYGFTRGASYFGGKKNESTKL
jgi:transposase